MSLRRAPLYYPDLVTLTRKNTVSLDRIDTSAGCSIKDSFASLELDGFDVLFDADWIWLDAPEATATRVEWRVNADNKFESEAGSFIPYASDGVVGITNVDGDIWADIPPVIARFFPGMPLVGYEHGDDFVNAVDNGFAPIGRLRIWHR